MTHVISDLIFLKLHPTKLPTHSLDLLLASYARSDENTVTCSSFTYCHHSLIKLASTQKEQNEDSIIAYHTRKNETFYCRNPAMLCPKYIGVCSFIKPTIVVDDDKSFCCKVQGIYRRRDWYDGTTSTRKNRGTR